MSSIQIACLLLVVSPATSTWMKSEKFKAAGCAAADKVKIEYKWTGYCGSETGTFRKSVCGSSKLTETRYADSACTTADTTATPVETNLTCTKSSEEEKWETHTCGVAPPSFAEYSKYATNACTTAVFSAKFPAGTCMLDQTSSGSDAATTWAAGSAMYSIEGTASNTTGLKVKKYTTDDCTGASTDTDMGTQCSDHGNGGLNGWTNVFAATTTTTTTPAAAVASVANNIRVFSLVVGFFCAATVLTYF